MRNKRVKIFKAFVAVPVNNGEQSTLRDISNFSKLVSGSLGSFHISGKLCRISVGLGNLSSITI